MAARSKPARRRRIRSGVIPDDDYLGLPWTPTPARPDAESDEAGETGEAGEEGEAGEARRPTRAEPPARVGPAFTAIYAVLSAALIGALVFGIIERRRANDNATKARNEQTAIKTAGTLGVAMLSYDSAHLDVSRQRVAALATPNFVKTYEQDFTKALGQLVSQLQAKSTATLKDVYLTKVTDGAAHAIVVLDFSVNSTAGTVSRPGTYLIMNLVRQHGQWKVDDVKALGFTGSETANPPAAGLPSASSTTTPTTAKP